LLHSSRRVSGRVGFAFLFLQTNGNGAILGIADFFILSYDAFRDRSHSAVIPPGYIGPYYPVDERRGVLASAVLVGRFSCFFLPYLPFF